MFRRRQDVGRRSGPAGESPWWDPIDQAVVEAVTVLNRRRLGKGWRPLVMVNNVERMDLLGEDAASEVIRAARDRRSLTALDEGRAWRHRDGGGLLVVRCEAYTDPDDSNHRAAWSEQGEAALTATWQQRWRERDRDPGWVECRRVPASTVEVIRARIADDRPDGAPEVSAVDWWRVEDHTDPSDQGQVTVYEHLMGWAGRGLATVTVRHELGTDVDQPTLLALAQMLGPLRVGLS